MTTCRVPSARSLPFRTAPPPPDRLSQPQRSLIRLLRQGHAISWDGLCATAADGFIDTRTFKALLRKGVVRFDNRREHYVLVETHPAGLNVNGGMKRILAIAEVLARQHTSGLDAETFAELLFAETGQMRPEFLTLRQCERVLHLLQPT